MRRIKKLILAVLILGLLLPVGEALARSVAVRTPIEERGTAERLRNAFPGLNPGADLRMDDYLRGAVVDIPHTDRRGVGEAGTIFQTDSVSEKQVTIVVEDAVVIPGKTVPTQYKFGDGSYLEVGEIEHPGQDGRVFIPPGFSLVLVKVDIADEGGGCLSCDDQGFAYVIRDGYPPTPLAYMFERDGGEYKWAVDADSSCAHDGWLMFYAPGLDVQLDELILVVPGDPGMTIWDLAPVD